MASNRNLLFQKSICRGYVDMLVSGRVIISILKTIDTKLCVHLYCINGGVNISDVQMYLLLIL